MEELKNKTGKDVPNTPGGQALAFCETLGPKLCAAVCARREVLLHLPFVGGTGFVAQQHHSDLTKLSTAIDQIMAQSYA